MATSGVRLQHRIDFGDLAAGFGQRGAGRGVVVQDEAALIDRRHEAGRHGVIGEPAEDQQRHQANTNSHGRREQPIQQPAVLRAPASRRRLRQGHASGRNRPGGAPAPARRTLSSGRRCQRRRHGDRQRLRKRAGHAAEEASGTKTISVARLEPVSGRRNSRLAGRTAALPATATLRRGARRAARCARP